MTDAQRKAMEWLDDCVLRYADSSASNYARTLKDMLARPVLPEEPDRDTITAMSLGASFPNDIVRDAVEAQRLRDRMLHVYSHLRHHLLKPRTKEVEVEGWAVITPEGYAGVLQRTKADAETWLWRCPEGSKVVRLTGKTTVPA